LKRVLKQVQLEGHLHTFRHTFISQALMRNVPEATVRARVDEDILRLYAHVSDAASRAFIGRFSDGQTNGITPPVGREERTA
jgi:hypothetical protein